MTDRNSGKIMQKISNLFSKEQLKSFIIDLLFVIVASTVGAYATVAVMVPNGMMVGGISGMVRLVQKYIDVNFSTMYYVFATIILVIMWIGIGFNSVKKALLVSIIYPGVLAIMERFDMALLESKDLILAAVFLGIFQGISMAFIFMRGYTFPGTDGLAKVIKKRFLPQISQGLIMSALDAIVIIAGLFIYGRNIALYALVTQVIIAKSLDAMMYGFHSKIVQLEIITEKEAEIAEYILNELHRGVTTTKVLGEYTKVYRAEMRVLCSTRESIEIKKKIREIDPGALVTLVKVETVWGSGFESIDKEEY